MSYPQALRLEQIIAFLPPGNIAGRGTYNRLQRKKSKLLAEVIREGEPFDEAFSARLFLQTSDMQSLGYFPDLSSFSPEWCRNVTKTDAWAFHWDQLLKLYESIITLASGHPGLSHGRRRNALRIAMARLESLVEEVPTQELKDRTRLALAEAYFMRGRIVRPKGFTVPAKKIELLNKALGQLDLLTRPLGDGAAKVSILRGEIYLVLVRYGQKKADQVSVLQTAVEQCNKTENHLLFEKFLLALMEATSSSPGDDKREIEEILNNKNTSALNRARAAALLSDFPRCMDHCADAIQQLESTPFFHEDWDRTVDLLKNIREKVDQGRAWAQLCERLWRTAVTREQQTAHGCHLRWYWSRQRDVYDLAFHAADTCQLKAEVADSLKDRPALHFSMLEKMADQDGYHELHQWLDAQTNGMLDLYILNFAAGQRCQVHNGRPASWAPTPIPWIAVHFYLANGSIPDASSKYGHALIYDSETDNWWHERFDYRPLWADYMAWQDLYAKTEDMSINDRIDKLSPFLAHMVESIGKEMHWLFDDDIFGKDKPVVFIPHDFLQRLPLHCAKSPNDGRFFQDDHEVRYLPAWWMMEGSGHAKPASPGMALINWDKDSANAQIMATQMNKSGWSVHNPARAEYLLSANAPSRLIIYAHGEARRDNPYESRLKLADGGPSIAQILKSSTMSLSGSTVLLGACETDLMVPLNNPLDEHITLASVLLQKGAETVSGALWKIHEVPAMELINACLSQTDTIRGWLDWYDNRGNDNQGLYHRAAMRLSGRPINSEE